MSFNYGNIRFFFTLSPTLSLSIHIFCSIFFDFFVTRIKASDLVRRFFILYFVINRIIRKTVTLMASFADSCFISLTHLLSIEIHYFLSSVSFSSFFFCCLPLRIIYKDMFGWVITKIYIIHIENIYSWW